MNDVRAAHDSWLVDFLHHNRSTFASVIRNDGAWVPLDLSGANSELQALGIIHTQALTNYIFDLIKNSGGTMGYGGYDEDRRWYQRSEAFTEVGGEPRTIHVGIDLWCSPGTPVYCPFEGVVHSFKDNAVFGDYGPTIILEHQAFERPFYTLYGHLSRASLTNLKVGKHFATGQELASIGAPPTNGDWPPHLHFQIISDMLGMEGDYPAVATQSKREYFLNLCPDPNYILQIEPSSGTALQTANG